MKPILYCSALGTTLLFAASTPLIRPAQAQTLSWQKSYTGAEAGDAIGLWHFDAADPTQDASGHGHTLRLRGENSNFGEAGRFGGGLQTTPNVDNSDKAQGASTPDADDLTPAGAFTIDLWMQPDSTIDQLNTAFLVDKKYYNYVLDKPEANADYMLLLRKAAANQYYLETQLGFRTDSVIGRSNSFDVTAGQWYHVAMSYDAKGNAAFYLNGRNIGEVHWKNRGAVSNGPHPLTIGDRVGSTFQRFAGRIDEVRLSPRAIRFASGKIIVDAPESRKAFYRMEKGALLLTRITNDTTKPLQGASLQISAPGLLNRRIPLTNLAPGQSAKLDVPLDTRMRAGRYATTLTVVNAQKKPIGETFKLAITIAPRPLPHTMPVVMWGFAQNLKDLSDIGFTHHLVTVDNDAWIWQEGKDASAMPPDQAATAREQLDRLLAAQLGGVATTAPGYYLAREQKQFNRVNRQGLPYDPNENPAGLLPGAQEYSYRVGAAIARTFGRMPSLRGALINSEIRDHTQLSFHPVEKAAYRAYSGTDIPAAISGARGISYESLPDFPADRVVPDDNPYLRFYRWFWKTGDGWNILNTKVSQGLKSTGRQDLWTFFDPAVRAPSIYGSGGDLDYISQWTYTYPDPLKIGLAADELATMAAGASKPQGFMNMTQIIWYRSQTAPIPEAGKTPPPSASGWEKEQPEAQFITIAPDHLSEALWLNLSRPLKGIMYHGWGSLVEKGDHPAYKLTNRETRVRLTKLLHEVVKPLGPTLLQIPAARTDVAFLESFAAQVFANRGTFGWGGGWGADSYLIANYAALQPRIVYDETIAKSGLNGYKILFLTDCDVLPQSVVSAIHQWQKRGGLVIGDDRLCPGIQPDIYLPSFNRTNKPDQDKATVLQKAADLRRELDAFYRHPIDSSNPDVMLHQRRFGSTDYIFTVNDHRTFGNYVGQYGLVMEKGLPAKATITVDRPRGVVYDLMRHRAVSTKAVGKRLQFNVDLGPGEGNVFAVVDAAPTNLLVNTAAGVQRGGSLPCRIQLNAAGGKPVNAVVPLKVTIRDPKGQVNAQSGPYGAPNGQLAISLDIAPNDTPGQWQIEVVEGLSGRKTVKRFTVG